MWIFAGNIQVVRVDELAVDLDKIVVRVDGRLSRSVVTQHRRGQRRIGERVVQRLGAKIEDMEVQKHAVLRS
jgi:hypothetical protein